MGIPMTMRELAALANVSVSTVSKAFHGAEDVSEETKEHIFAIARKYGCFGKYYRGQYARKVIAIVCPEIGSAYYNRYVEELQKLVEESGGIVLVSSDNFEREDQQELVEYYASYLKADGMFIFDQQAPLKKGYSIPVVSLLSNRALARTHSLQVNLEEPMKDAISHLRSLGHKHILFAGERLTGGKAAVFREAATGFQAAADDFQAAADDFQSAANGFQSAEFGSKTAADEERYELFESAYRFEEAGIDAAKNIIKRKKRPTAVICAYDNIAVGLIRYLKEQGYSVPGDFSVIGMDNIRMAQYLEHSLTTIDCRIDETCTAAWELMKKKLKNPYYTPEKSQVVTGKLIIRETTGIISPGDSAKRQPQSL